MIIFWTKLEQEQGAVYDRKFELTSIGDEIFYQYRVISQKWYKIRS